MYGDIFLGMGSRIDDTARFELSRLKPEERPHDIPAKVSVQHSIRALRDDWETPQSWTYYDKDLPDWYE